jgi:hypothetical protein
MGSYSSSLPCPNIDGFWSQPRFSFGCVMGEDLIWRGVFVGRGGAEATMGMETGTQQFGGSHDE